MNRALLFLGIFFTILLSTAVYGQKGSLFRAQNLLVKPDIAGAKLEIDSVIKIEKQAQKPAAWKTRGEIYGAIYNSDDPAIQNLSQNAGKEAADSYRKALSLMKPSNLDYETMRQEIELMWGKAINKGVEYNNSKDYINGYKQFAIAQQIKPNDTLSLLNGAIMAQQAKLYPEAMQFYSQLVDINKANEDVFTYYINLLRSEKQDEKALEILGKAKEKYPLNADFAKEEINLYLTLNRLDEAIEKIEKSLTQNPNNVSYRLNLSILYDQTASNYLKNDDQGNANIWFNKAKESYIKTLELDPENYSALYNIGVLYYNEGILIQKQKIEIEDKSDKIRLKFKASKNPAEKKKLDNEMIQLEKEVAKVEEDVKKVMILSLPYFEKAMKINSIECQLLYNINRIYYILKDNTKQAEIDSKIKENKCD